MDRVHSADYIGSIPTELVARLEALAEDFSGAGGDGQLVRDAAAIRAVLSELKLWRTGRRVLSTMPNGHPCVMDYPEDLNAEVRDSETGEVLFPARKAPFRVIEGVCVCVARGDGPEGCGICNETGKPTSASSVDMSAASRECAQQPPQKE